MATVFIVEDEEDLHYIYKALLSVKGHVVVASAFDGDEAIEKYSQLDPKPDIIMMDHRMPKMDGISATRELKQACPDCKIIFISADETVRQKAMEAGAEVFQVKPIRAHELYTIITQLTSSA
ncbi:MAG: response regulator [Promethearchaeota archaeon]